MDVTELGSGYELDYFGSGKGALEWWRGRRGGGGGGGCLDIQQLYTFSHAVFMRFASLL